MLQRTPSLVPAVAAAVVAVCLTLLLLLPARAEEPAAAGGAPGADVTQVQIPVEPSGASGVGDGTGARYEEEIIGNVSLVERLSQGGKTMIFLLALSVIAVTFTVERGFRLRRGAVVPDGLKEEAISLWRSGKHEELLDLCARRPSTLASIIDAFVRHRHCTSLELSMLAGDIAGRDMRGHLQKAYPIAVVATLSPLLGLLGTVIGMIESFEVVAIAGSLGDASLLAGGISKALVTTATGLVIAVPALGLYHFFKSRTNALTMALEGEVHELLTSWFMDRDARQPAAEG